MPNPTPSMRSRCPVFRVARTASVGMRVSLAQRDAMIPNFVAEAASENRGYQRKFAWVRNIMGDFVGRLLRTMTT
jgi:hypothetical protein